MLRDGLQPTDFADAKVGVSAWRPFEHYGKTAVRVWTCRTNGWWFHQHEWAIAGKNSTEKDGWILYGYYPLKKWDEKLLPPENDA